MTLRMWEVLLATFDIVEIQSCYNIKKNVLMGFHSEPFQICKKIYCWGNSQLDYCLNSQVFNLNSCHDGTQMDKLKIPPPLPNSNLWPPLSPGPLLRNLPFFNHGTCSQLWYSWIVTRYSWNSRKASRYTSDFYFLPTTWEDSKSLFHVLFEAFLVEVTSITQITTKSVRGKNCSQISEQRDTTWKGIKNGGD